VPDGSVDSTAPSTPSAPTYVSETTYTGGDGTVYARVTIACPALPSGGKLNQILYRVSGATLWTIADEMTGAGNLSVGDLAPNTAYEFAVRAISFANVPSAVSSTLSRTAPNKTGAPGVPTGTSLVSGAGAAPVLLQGSVLMFACRVVFAAPADTDLAFIELKATATDSDGATDYSWTTGGSNELFQIPSSPSQTFDVYIYNASASAGFVRVRSKNSSGVASAWVSIGNAASSSGLPAGNMTEQNKTAIAVTGGTATGITDLAATSVKTGSGSSIRAIKARYVVSQVVSVAGGSASEDFSVDLTNRGFTAKPDAGTVQVCASTVAADLRDDDAIYVYDHGSNSSTTAYVSVFRKDGANLTAADIRLSIEFIEYD